MRMKAICICFGTFAMGALTLHMEASIPPIFYLSNWGCSVICLILMPGKNNGN